MKFLLQLAMMAGFFSGPLYAVNLSWQDCLKFTSEGNPSLDAAKKDWLATQLNEKVALAGYLPRLSASTSATQTGSTGQGGGSSGAGGIVTNGIILNSGTGSQVNTNYLGAVNLSQNIFNGLEDHARIEQAEWRSQYSRWAYVSAKSNVSFALKDAFSSLVFAQESVDLAQSIFERRESNYKLVSVRYENGRENRGSVLLAEAYFEQAKLDLIKANDSLAVAQTKLKSLMNKDYLDKIEVIGDVPLPPLADPSKIADLAIETPVYNQALSLEKASQEDISIARSSFLPNLDLTGNVTRTGNSYFPQQRERWAVAITLTIPIFDGLKDQSTLKSAVFTRYANEGKKRNALLDLLPKIRDALNQARQSDIKYSIDGKFQKATGTRAEIARAKYNNGLITFEDWDIIENELIQRQNAYLQSKRDRVLKYATWENLLGRGAIE